jgi:glycosyltransferase involved in cell wall biosynthesis
MQLYHDGRRRIVPPLVFGVGVLWHLLRRGRRYDVVHTASFPYFSLLAIGAASVVHSYRVFVDWHEVWTRQYWREYLGSMRGTLGWAIQRLCMQIGNTGFCFSRLHAARLRNEGFRSPITLLEGEYAGPLDCEDPSVAEPIVLSVSRHIPEKRVTAVIPAFAQAREVLPELRCRIYGDGPERKRVLELIDDYQLADAVDAPGFVTEEEVNKALRDALCLVLPSRREGYGLVVVEASARGTPSIVVDGPDNAAVELVEDGVNGFVARTAEPGDLADAILRVHEAGFTLRQITAAWFRRNRARLLLEGSLEHVITAYRTP